MTENFHDQGKNFYLNLIHMNVAFLIEVTIILAISTTQIAYLQYIYGLIKIAKIHKLP
jgi:predicted Zn-dependent protease